jgi:cardiolipin synthase
VASLPHSEQDPPCEPDGAQDGEGDAFPPSPWFRVGGDAVRLLRDGEQAFPAMLKAIEQAQREVLLEMYWVGPDTVGERFRDALAARAQAGVRVCVIYDAVGSMGVTPRWWQPLFTAGGRAVEYHSISPLDPRFRLERVELRDHRKMLVVDGQQGFTGGINLAVPWLKPEEGGAGWRDDVIQVRGGATQELRTLFFRTWRKLTSEAAPLDVRPLSRRRVGPVWVLASQWRTRRSIHREYVRRIRGARRAVDIANSYFVPDRRVRTALFHAVLRGVSVRVLVPAKSDVPVVQFAVEALFDTLLRHGVEVWTLPGVMLHAKTAIIDDEFTTVGSYNLDERSWRKNLEVNLAVEDRAFARHVRAWFERDLASATRIDLATWRSRSLARRGFEWASYAMRKLW